jgi:predicted amidohydrolase YtcJ
VDQYAADLLTEETLFNIKNAIWRIAAMLSVFSGYPAPSQTHAPNASAIIVHGRIYTLDTKHPWAVAVAIRGEKIIAVGTDQKIRSYHAATTKVIDARGRLVLPAFTDCHVHFMDGSQAITEVALDDVTTVAEIQKRVKAYAAAHPKDAWVLGRGWTYPVFAPADCLTKIS